MEDETCKDCKAEPGQYCLRDCKQQGCKNPDPDAPYSPRQLQQDLVDLNTVILPEVGCYLLTILVWIDSGSFIAAAMSLFLSMILVIVLRKIIFKA